MSSSGSRDDQLLSTAASDVASEEGEVTGDAGRSLRENSCTPAIERRDARTGVDCLLGKKKEMVVTSESQTSEQLMRMMIKPDGRGLSRLMQNRKAQGRWRSVLQRR